MTKTALKALTVAAVSAASILLGSGVALANPGDQPSDCQPGEEFQGEFGCVAVQLPEETQGREYDPIAPEDPCFRQDPECYDAPPATTLGQPGPAAEPQTDAAPQAATPSVALGSPSAGPAPLDHAATPGTAHTADPVPVATRLTDIWAQILDWIRMFLGGRI